MTSNSLTHLDLQINLQLIKTINGWIQNVFELIEPNS